MTDRKLLGWGVLLISTLLVLTGDSAQSDTRVWKAYPDAEINALYFNRSLPDEVVVRGLTERLDERLDMQTVRPPRGYNNTYARDCELLLGLIAFRPAEVGVTARPKAIASVLQRFGSLKLGHPAEVESYLNVALAMAGGTASAPLITAVVEDPRQPIEIRSLAMLGMSKSSVPVEAVPKLIEALQDPWLSGVVIRGRGEKPRRLYPLRENARAALRHAGIEVEEVVQEEANEDDPENPVVEHATYTVERRSLLTRLRAWLVDEDPAVWKGAVGILSRLPGSDVGNLVAELGRAGKLSPERQALIGSRLR